jgi:sporulation protein YlmC with PRC-barrel domain
MLARCRRTALAVIAFAVLTSSAQSQDTQQPPAAAAPTTVLDAQEVEGILGRNVLGRTGEKMGQIVDVLVDRDGQVRAAVIDFGGFLGVGIRRIAVDWSAVHFVSNGKSVRVVLDLTRDEVVGSPEYKPGETVPILGPPSALDAPNALPPK